MNFKKLTSLFIAALSVVQVFAQENSILWKISGKDLKQDSYILGTIHLICPDNLNIPNKVIQAIENSDQVIFELNLADPNTMAQMQQNAMTPNLDYFKDLDPTKVLYIDSVLASNGLSIKMFDMMSPTTISSLLALKALNCPNPMEVKSIEGEIIALAKDKKIDALETVDFQINLMNDIFTPEYFYQYMTTYNTAPEKLNSLTQAYKDENLDSLSKLINDPETTSEEQLHKMLTQRNVNWTTILPEKIKNTKSVIAVGAAHLVGDDGIIKQLQDKGYTVTPVKE